MIKSPIWKDIEYRSSADTLDYEIWDENNNVIHNGITMRMPDQSGITLNVNSRLEEYLKPDFKVDFTDSETDVIENPDGYREFSYRAPDVLETYGFLYDWSYEEDWTGQTHYNMSNPINGHIDQRMMCMFTNYDSTETGVDYCIEWVSYLNLHPNYITFPDNGGVKTIEVESNSGWEITSMPEWISANVTAGTGNTVVTLTADSNPRGYDRTDALVFTYPDGTAVLDVLQYSVIQLSVTPNSLNVPYSGGTYSVDIESNVDWVSVSPEWVQVSPVSGTGDTTVSVEVDTNASFYERTGDVVVVGGDERRNVGITQDASQELESLLTFNITTSGTINWKLSSSTGEPKTILYRVNDGEWTQITSSTAGSSFNVSQGDIVKFKGDNQSYAKANYWNTFSESTAGFTLSGNIMSLISSNGFDDITAFTSNNNYVFSHMFYGCTGLTDASSLIMPAEVLCDRCYVNMFEDCTSLTAVPVLPARTLAYACYMNMFQGCSLLATTPELPATSLTEGCYANMFRRCTNLTTAPELPAPTLVKTCYANMFSACTQLNYVKCLATDISADSCVSNWLKNVSPSGIFVKDPSMISWTIGASGIPVGWAAVDDVTPETYLTFAITSPGDISWTTTSPSLIKTISYRKNGGQWTNISPIMEGTKFSVTTGDVIEFKGNNSAYGNSANTNTFSGSTAEFSVRGNIMSLINSASFSDLKTLTDDYTFKELFSYTYITSSNDLLLPATTLTKYCYDGMFYNCGDMTSTPELPATIMKIGCYQGMFNGSAITTAPELPATTLADRCYSLMFSECPLTTAPSLPVTTMKQYCYSGMFAGCTSITTAPDLPATTLAYKCYSGMFSGCTSLTTVSNLPATTLYGGCYMGMFEGCISLTTAPELPATTLADECYFWMFKGCSSLNYIKCLATDISATDSTYGWVQNVSSSGTFVKAPSMQSWTTGVSGIPNNWTVIDAQ